MDNHLYLELSYFTGSEQFFKFWANSKLIYTEGVHYLAQEAKCHWLIEEIGLAIFPRLLKEYRDWFYSMQLLVYPDRSAMIIVGDGNGNIHLNHPIKQTDFPILGKPVKFYLCESDKCYCLMLVSEY